MVQGSRAEICLDRSSCDFFQAEDGIRDLTVTGVQTCALPISLSVLRYNPGKRCTLAAASDTDRYIVKLFADAATVLAVSTVHNVLAGAGLASGRGRSEERRVGKECRSRWSPYH